MVGVWVLGSIMMQAFGIDINISSKSLGNLMLIHLLVIFFPIFRREIRHYKAKQTWRLQSEKDKERVKSECHRAELLEQQRNLIIKQQNNTYELLERLYDLDVVYPKYRSIMPIVTMYEYFESSRCHSLTGEHGAYNLYESESRQDIIISKLDDVLINLEQIKQNQYRIYREISEANMLAEEICSTAGRLAASGQSIEKNSAAAAFQAKQAAQYSAIAAYVNAFE